MLNFTRKLMGKFDFRLENFLNSFTGKSRHGAVAVILAAPIVIIAGTYMVFRRAKHACKRKNDGVFARSMSIGALHGGILSLERLTYYHQARADAASLNTAESELKVLLAEEQPDFKKLQVTQIFLHLLFLEFFLLVLPLTFGFLYLLSQFAWKSIVAKLEMSGKEAFAVEILERAVDKARKDKKPHEAYEIEMLLVEMLIYKVLFLTH